MGHDYIQSNIRHTCSRCQTSGVHVYLIDADGRNVCGACGYVSSSSLNFAPTTNNNVCDGVDCGISKYYQSETILTKKETAILNKDEDDLIIMD